MLTIVRCSDKPQQPANLRNGRPLSVCGDRKADRRLELALERQLRRRSQSSNVRVSRSLKPEPEVAVYDETPQARTSVWAVADGRCCRQRRYR
eukprot:967674-Prymnesium_polylepis.1